MWAKRRLRNFACITGTALYLLTTGAVAQQTTYSPQEFRALAAKAVQTGHPKVAYDISQALLQRDPMDMDALLIGSRAARDLSDFKTARSLARRAWDSADQDVERYASSLAMAQALSSNRNHTRAQFWLRRADHYAPNPVSKQRVRRDFNYVKSRNRLSTSFSFNIAPTSNLNGGSVNDTITLDLGGVPLQLALQGSALALSGTEISGAVSSRYRLSETETSKTTLSLLASHRTYRLSNDAKALAPTAKGSDFSDSRLVAGLSQQNILPGTGFGLGWSSSASHVWYGGKPLYQGLSLGVSGEYSPTPKGSFRLQINHEWQQGLNGRDDADVLSGKFRYITRMSSGNQLTLSLGGTRSRSNTSFMDYDETQIGADLALAKPVFGTSLSFDVGARQRHYDSTPYSSGARDDTTYSASVTAVFNKFDYYGFVPSMTVQTQKTASNLNLYDSNEVGLQMGFKSAF